jgi:putative ABC transport system permease protein
LFSNYLKVAIRNFLKHKGYSFINLFGLAVGMSCSILIVLFIRDEFRYDRYVPKADQVYRLALRAQTRDRGLIQTARTPPPWAPALAADYPEIEGYVRMKTPLVSWLISYEAGDKRFHEKGFYFADAAVFDFFGFEMIKGDPETALRAPRSVVLTETAARKYFGDDDPMNRILRADNTYDFRVTGIMRDVPRNSHFSFDILASFESLVVLPIYSGNAYVDFQRNGLNPDVYTYLRLKNGVRPVEFEKKMPGFLDKYLAHQISQIGIRIEPFLQPLLRIHLHSNIEAEIGANSSITTVTIFSAVASFILLVACINFMNLATARSAGRAQEVGLRKVVGAERRQLISQFLGETLFMAVLALLLSLAFSKVLLPVFKVLSGKELSLSLTSGSLILSLVGITLLVGLIAGSYPALFLSSFQPANVIRGSIKSGQAAGRLRQGLVVFQFAVSIVFIIGTGIVFSQLKFVQDKRLGFDKENVIVLSLGDPRARVVYRTFIDRVIQNPDVVSAAGTSSLPGGLTNMGFVRPEGADVSEQVPMELIICDHDFIKTMGIELAAGRDFSLDHSTDVQEALLLNETAVGQLGWEGQPLNKQIFFGNLSNRVIGVVKDFHVKSLHTKIGALFLHLAPHPDPIHYIAVRIRPGNIGRTLSGIEKAWREVYPHDPFAYSFLDEDLDHLYRAEELRSRVFLAFSVLTILIACLGLFGLASFTAEQKTKEIGIRKVLGASTASLVRLLTKEFMKLVLLASLVSWPIAYVIMRNWLRSFAYRTEMGPETFAMATVLAVLIALLTVGYQALKASLSNPADAIRMN